MTNNQKYKLVRNSITKTHIPKLFDELVAGGGQQYHAMFGAKIGEEHGYFLYNFVLTDLFDDLVWEPIEDPEAKGEQTKAHGTIKVQNTLIDANQNKTLSPGVYECDFVKLGDIPDDYILQCMLNPDWTITGDNRFISIATDKGGVSAIYHDNYQIPIVDTAVAYTRDMYNPLTSRYYAGLTDLYNTLTWVDDPDEANVSYSHGIIQVSYDMLAEGDAQHVLEAGVYDCDIKRIIASGKLGQSIILTFTIDETEQYVKQVILSGNYYSGEIGELTATYNYNELGFGQFATITDTHASGEDGYYEYNFEPAYDELEWEEGDDDKLYSSGILKLDIPMTKDGVTVDAGLYECRIEKSTGGGKGGISTTILCASIDFGPDVANIKLFDSDDTFIIIKHYATIVLPPTNDDKPDDGSEPIGGGKKE